MKLKVTSAALPLLGLSLLLSLSSGSLRADSVDATVSKINGSPMYTSPSGQTAAITPAATIPVGSTVSTGAGGWAGLQLVPGAVTVPGADTKVKVQSLTYSKSPDGVITRHVVLNLSRGTVFCSLAKKDGNSSFQIVTPMGVAAARGTDWSVTVTGDGITIVQVADGSITFTLPNGTVITIPPGSSYDAGTNTVSGLTPEELQAIITALTDAGFTLAGTPGAGGGGEYTNGLPINPANVSILPENSASGSGGPTPTP